MHDAQILAGVAMFAAGAFHLFRIVSSMWTDRLKSASLRRLHLFAGLLAGLSLFSALFISDRTVRVIAGSIAYLSIVFLLPFIGYYIYLKMRLLAISKAPSKKEKVEEEIQITPRKISLIPTDARMEGMMIIGPPGVGKTQFLSSLIAVDLFAPCSLVVFDSAGDIISNILKADIPRHRVVYINPKDVDYPISLSLFDVENIGVTNYDKQKNYNSTVNLILYVLSSLDAAVTSKQELPLRMVVKLCLEIPGATIETLKDVLLATKEEFQIYDQYVSKLPSTSQSFFQREYFNKDYSETRQHISRRISQILESPLGPMFTSRKSKLRMRELLDNGSVILIETPPEFLGPEGVVFFTRFITSLVLQAILARDPLRHEDNLDVFMYIDEAAPIISEQTTHLLTTVRKYRLGLTLAFQSLEQIKAPGVADVLVSSTAIKAIGQGASVKDVKALASNMRIDEEAFLNVPRFHFFTHVRGRWSKIFKVEHGDLGKLPRRTDLKQLIEENREKYARRVSDVAPPKPEKPDFADTQIQDDELVESLNKNKPIAQLTANRLKK